MGIDVWLAVWRELWYVAFILRIKKVLVLNYMTVV